MPATIEVSLPTQSTFQATTALQANSRNSKARAASSLGGTITSPQAAHALYM